MLVPLAKLCGPLNLYGRDTIVPVPDSHTVNSQL
jgi:hypothetical protein